MIGFKIYYEKSTGNVILTIPEKHNANAKQTTKEQDFLMFDVLSIRNPKEVEVLQLGYGEHRNDFQIANSWSVNMNTGKLEFQFPQFNLPSSGQISQLQEENKNLQFVLGNMLIGNALDKEKITEVENTIGALLLEIALLKDGGVE